MNGFRLSLASIMLAIPLSAAHSADCSALQDGSDHVGIVCGRANANDSVIVLIAGLGGSKTWTKLRQYIINDDDLAGYDLLEYHTPKSKRIEEHFDYVAHVVNERWPDVRNLIIVGHSIGGIVVRSLAIEDPADRTFPVEPQFVITYATPYEERRFHRNLVQTLASGFGFLVGAVKPLHKEAFDEEKIAAYTKQWRAKVEEDEEAVAKTYMAIYGTSDKTAPAENERGKPFVVVIEGTHRKVVQPTSSNSCPYQVLKHMIVNGQHGPAECLVP